LKYVDLPHGSSVAELLTLGSSNGAIEVEAVGLDKVRQRLSNLTKLREASLDGGNVSFPNPPGEVHAKCPSCLP
jgi:hypothetical protein